MKFKILCNINGSSGTIQLLRSWIAQRRWADHVISVSMLHTPHWRPRLSKVGSHVTRGSDHHHKERDFIYLNFEGNFSKLLTACGQPIPLPLENSRASSNVRAGGLGGEGGKEMKLPFKKIYIHTSIVVVSPFVALDPK